VIELQTIHLSHELRATIFPSQPGICMLRSTFFSSTLLSSTLLSVAALVGCSADTTDPLPSGSDTASDDTADDTDEQGADLIGGWASACYANTQTTFTYTETTFTGTYDEYSDEACTTAYHTSAWSGTYVVGASDSEGVTPIDLAFLTFTSTALTEENAAQNNSYAYCGFTDWAAGEQKDILGAECYGFSIPVGARSLDIYRIDGDELRFGQGAEIAVEVDASSRPSVIDETRVFTRR